MSKVLTISVAAYNVEAYIKENIESIIRSDAKDDIEVLVIDDGGKDRTIEFAKEFESKHPGIVCTVHKENGGYGSVQNYSISRATGKYFKILDGDDWVETEGLTRLVQYLKANDVDAAVTSYFKGPDRDSMKEFNFGKRETVNQLLEPNQLRTAIGMWALTFKTEVLRKSGVMLPEKTLYTDRIYSTIPFSVVKNVIILDFPVYCYRTGRDGQSVSRESRINHIDEYIMVTKKICEHYRGDKRKHKEYILLKASAAYKVSIRALLLLPTNKNNLEKLKSYEQDIKNIVPDVYKKSASLSTRMGWVITFLRMTGYKGYWVLGKVPKDKIDY